MFFLEKQNKTKKIHVTTDFFLIILLGFLAENSRLVGHISDCDLVQRSEAHSSCGMGSAAELGIILVILIILVKNQGFSFHCVLIREKLGFGSGSEQAEPSHPQRPSQALLGLTSFFSTKPVKFGYLSLANPQKTHPALLGTPGCAS